MRLVVLYGPPAVGKLTVARELAALTGYRLFHNHLAVDLLLSVFEFGSEPFRRLREATWLDVLSAACRERLPGVIFTFAPERTVDPSFFDRLDGAIAANGGEIVFVELHCSADERRRRLGNASRHEHGKLTSVELFDALDREGAFAGPPMPPPRLSIDTGLVPAREAAAQIHHALGPARFLEKRGRAP